MADYTDRTMLVTGAATGIGFGIAQAFHATGAWTFDSGDAYDDSEMQCNPLIIDVVVDATTPKVNVVALDAATGALRWL